MKTQVFEGKGLVDDYLWGACVVGGEVYVRFLVFESLLFLGFSVTISVNVLY